MAHLGGFNANNVEPAQSFDVIPPGKYKGKLVASEMRPTKNGVGQYLWLEFEVTDGERASRKLWDRLNIDNPNQQAVDIANRQLSALCRAVGKLEPNDSEELHLIPLILNVRVRKGNDNYADSNEIRGYESVNGSGATASAAKPAAGPTTAAGPWKQARKAG